MSDRLQRRVEQLLNSSNEVLDQCALPNGALVAANSDLAVYPSTAENYRFSWARDAAYQLLAAHALSPGVAEDRAIRYSEWLMQVQNFADTGLYLKRYGTNGALDVRYGEHFQPDQAGALIGALDNIVPDKHAAIDAAIGIAAIGLHSRWNGDGFGATQDLWENRETTEAAGDVFTYSLAAVRHGLGIAATRLQDGDAHDANLRQMSQVLDHPTSGAYSRKIYPAHSSADPDNTLDASLAGLAYPFYNPQHPKTVATVTAIDKDLYHEGAGVIRYWGDTYDGIVRHNSQEATAGAWPLLTFWHAIALHATGSSDRAKDVYLDTIERLDHEYTSGNLPDNLIPEQLYPDTERQGKGVLPLAWSHAKFVLATKVLRLME